jgi:hypothetical protein
VGTTRRIAAFLLLAAAALFVAGVRAEDGGHAASAEAGETAESHEEAGEEGSTLLGVDPESSAAVAVAVMASVVLAAGIGLSRRRGVAWAVVAFGLSFAVLDAVEAGRQSAEHRTGLVVLAAAVALGHLGAAGAAGAAIAPSRRSATG